MNLSQRSGIVVLYFVNAVILLPIVFIAMIFITVLVAIVLLMVVATILGAGLRVVKRMSQSLWMFLRGLVHQATNQIDMTK